MLIPRLLTSILRILLAAVVYWVAGRLALLMAIPPGYATAVWPAAGLALVCVLAWGPRAAIGVALGSLCVNLGTSSEPVINMHVRKLDDAASRDALEECQTRVQAIALIHEKLYQSRDYARVPFSEYARSLVTNVFHATGVAPGAVQLETSIEDVAVPVDIAIPCGLLLNELITNALKHAFKGGRRGRLQVALFRTGARLHLVVSDDGVGLPAGFDLQHSGSLGLQLVSTLAEQLGASLTIGSRDGARFEIAFDMENG